MSFKAPVPFRVVWGFFMTAAFVVISYLVFFTPLLIPYNAVGDIEDSNATLRIIFGVVFLVYGLMRGYTTWMSLKKNKK